MSSTIFYTGMAIVASINLVIIINNKPNKTHGVLGWLSALCWAMTSALMASQVEG